MRNEVQLLRDDAYTVLFDAQIIAVDSQSDSIIFVKVIIYNDCDNCTPYAQFKSQGRHMALPAVNNND